MLQTPSAAETLMPLDNIADKQRLQIVSSPFDSDLFRFSWAHDLNFLMSTVEQICNDAIHFVLVQGQCRLVH